MPVSPVRSFRPLRVVVAAAIVLAASSSFGQGTSGLVGAQPVVEAESRSELLLSWTVAAGRQVHRIALPPGHRAEVDEVVALAADGRAIAPPGGGRALEGVLSLGPEGYLRRTRFVPLALEPGGLPAGAVVRARIRFVESDAATGEPAASPAPADRRARAALWHSGARGVLNARTARALRDEIARTPSAWPPTSVRESAGPLPRLSPFSGPALRGIEGGRVKVLVGPRGLEMTESDGAWERVEHSGIHRITGAQLAEVGVDISRVEPQTLVVLHRGAAGVEHEEHVRVMDAGTPGVMDETDYLELFAEPLTDDEFDNFYWFQGADYTDQNGYLIATRDEPVPPGASRDATPTDVHPTYDEELEVARFERNDSFIGRTGVARWLVDHFYWCPTLLYTGSPDERTESLRLPGLVTDSERPAKVRVQLLQQTALDHRVQVDVNGTRVGSDLVSEGFVVDRFVAPLDASQLTDVTDVTVRLPGPDVAGTDQAELDWIEIEYPKRLRAEDDQVEFVVDAAPVQVRVSGLSDTADVSAIFVEPLECLDDDPLPHGCADPVAPAWLEGLRGSRGTVEFVAEQPGRYAVAAFPGGASSRRPSAVEWVPDSGLRDAANDAQLLVVAPRAWLASPALRPALDRYVAFRRSEGLTVREVAIEAAIDEFHSGQASPFALHYLLQHALATWDGPPEHVLILGDASVDYKDDLDGRLLGRRTCEDIEDACGFNEPAWNQDVMTVVLDAPRDTVFVGHYGSDAVMTTVAGEDSLPDVNAGRLPVRTPEDAASLLDKIVDYEELRQSMPPWSSRVILVGDQIRATGEDVIEQSQDAAMTSYLGAYSPRTYYYQSEFGAENPEELTSELLSDWTGPGAAVLSYVGHGNALNWSDDKLMTNQSPADGCRNDVLGDLAISGPQPVVLNVGCITGAFMRRVGPALLEELVRQPTGGAIAAYGPTGLTDIGQSAIIVDAFYLHVHGPLGRGLRLGDVVLGVQDSLDFGAGTFDALMGNVLLGDPALNLAIPFGPPAPAVETLLRATPGDGQVTIEWDEVTGADAYNLHRTAGGSIDVRDAELIAVGVLEPRPVSDTEVVNGTLYHYFLEPVADGFPGRWSLPAPARPCAEVAPEPPGAITVTPFRVPGFIDLEWEPSPSSNLQDYVVRLFEGPGPDGRLVVERAPLGPMLGPEDIVPCRLYTVQVRARDRCGKTSTVSSLTFRAPECEVAVDAPEMIRDLRLRRTGGELELTWSDVTATIRGEPFVADAYVVHRRAASADWLPDEASVAERVVPSVSVQALGDPALEFFLVAAEGSMGERGPLGFDFPSGVTGLEVDDGGGMDYVLSWDPVTVDLEGRDTVIARYHVHASDAPIGRADLSAATLVTTVPGTELSARVPQARGANHFVVAEDIKGNLSVN